jgi:TldD protein
MLDLARELVAGARSSGAHYAEGRVVQQVQQVITCTNGESMVTETQSLGFGIRVLVGGHWGFASQNVSEGNLAQTVARAVELARAAPWRSRHVELSDADAVQDTYETPCERDPFDVPTFEKVALLTAITNRMLAQSEKVQKSQADLHFGRETSWLATSEGTEIEQTLTRSGLSTWAVVKSNGRLLKRSYPSCHGDHGSGGYELIEALKPLEAANRVVQEAIELVDAPRCDEGVMTVILEPSVLGMVIHETLGHAIELDRAFGDEADNFGSSFLRPYHLGTFQYGSDLVTIVADATRPEAVATYGYDHEGVEARRIPIIQDGVFKDYLMARESAHGLGLTSNGTARASSWNRIPMERMTNLCLVPGEYTKERLISETDNGVYIETFKGCDIDASRLSFSFTGERGWRIRNGRIVGLVKYPVIYGETPTFWRNCSGIAGPDEDHVVGILACGKGLPWQFVPTGQGGPPARFEKVRVGSV